MYCVRTDVKMKLISKSNKQTVWSTERGIAKLLEVSNGVTSTMNSIFGCTVVLDVKNGTVTIDGGKVTDDAEKWFGHKLALVRVNSRPCSQQQCACET